MAKVLIEETNLTNIANAIREKTGKTDLITPPNMASEIESIKSGDDTELLSLLDGTAIELKLRGQIRPYCFYKHSGLKKIIPVEGATIKIKQYAFSGCTGITEVINKDRSISSIETRAFENCTSLSKIDVRSVALFGSAPFYGCTALTTLIMRSTSTIPMTETTSSSRVFYNLSQTVYVYVPASMVDSYKTSSYWKAYANNIRAIEDYPDICG